MSDLGWARRLAAGDKRAGERWIAEQYPGVHRMLWCLTRDPEASADLTQQTFVKAWQSLGSYRGEAQLSTWLHRIAYHEYTHWLRGRRPTVPLASLTEVADPRAVQDLKTILLARALAKLTDELRDTFLLFHGRELSTREVAAILDVPEGTVKSRLFAARARLRELLVEPADGFEAAPAHLPAPAALGRSPR